MFKRESYLKKIRGFYHDDGMVKVITGVRRCWKSCLMHTIEEELRDSGVPDSNIAYFDLDRYGFRSVKTPGQLEALIEPLLGVDGDEIPVYRRGAKRRWLRGGHQRV